MERSRRESRWEQLTFLHLLISTRLKPGANERKRPPASKGAAPDSNPLQLGNPCTGNERGFSREPHRFKGGERGIHRDREGGHGGRNRFSRDGRGFNRDGRDFTCAGNHLRRGKKDFKRGN